MTPLDILVTQDMVTVALLTTPLLALLKPYLSLLPIATPDASSRNAVLTGVGYVLNLAGLVGMLYAQSALDWRYWLMIVAAAAGQQGISHAAYLFTKSSIPGLSGGADTATTPQRIHRFSGPQYKGLPPFGSVAFQPPDPPVASGTPSPVDTVEPTA